MTDHTMGLISPHEIAVILVFTIAPIMLVYACWKDWSHGRRIRTLEDKAYKIGNAVPRVRNSVLYTEAQQATEARLMAAIDAEPPTQLYRREGRRFIRAGNIDQHHSGANAA